MRSSTPPQSVTALQPMAVAVGHKSIGQLMQEDGLCIFRYNSAAVQEDFVSLTMPVRTRDYTHSRLLPIFEMHLPEGYLLALLQRHFAKLTQTDDFGVLHLLAPAVRGRLHYRHGPAKPEQHNEPAPLTLTQLLHPSQQEDLFQELVQRFALQSAISGVQPKVLATVLDKATLRLEDYIVKAWGPEYPELALNEYWCMRVMQAAGLPVPQFHLSDDATLLVVKRFDVIDDSGTNRYLGFEDMCVLQARSRQQKYAGSYEQVAKTIHSFVSPVRKTNALQQFFQMMVLNMLLQNGDAHLKNFGLLYQNTDDIWLAPAYDVVCTTAYIRNDRPALTLLGKRAWLGRKDLLRFGVQSCGLTLRQAEHLYAICCNAILEVAPLVRQAASGARNAAQQEVLTHLSKVMLVAAHDDR